MPIASQMIPTGATPSLKCSATVTSQEAPQPMNPSTANSGRSYEPTWNDSGPRQGMSARAQRAPHLDHRGVREREREHRAEGVQVAEEGDRARRDHQEHRDHAVEDDGDVRRVELRVDVPDRLRQLAVLPHRVRQPGHADDARVRRDDQDRRRQDRDVVGHALLDRVRDRQVLDEAGDGVARELAGQVGRRLAELHRLRAREHRIVRVSAPAGRWRAATGSAESATDGRNA